MFNLKKNFREDSVEAYVTNALCGCNGECATCHCGVSRDKQSYTYNSTMSSISRDEYVNSAFPR